MIFLETDVLFELLNKKSSKGDEIFQKLEKSNESFAITSITFYEMVSFFMLRGRQVPPINFFKDLFLFIYKNNLFYYFSFFLLLLLLKFVLEYSEVLIHDFKNILGASFGIP